MTTVIKIGDTVSWRRSEIKSRSVRFADSLMLQRLSGCKVLALFDIEGRAAALLDCDHAQVNCFVEDLELDEPDKTTILSGG